MSQARASVGEAVAAVPVLQPAVGVAGVKVPPVLVPPVLVRELEGKLNCRRQKTKSNEGTGWEVDMQKTDGQV